MRNILFILEKEFKQIFRNKAMIPIIFIMPIIQLIVLANAATYDVKNLKLMIVDKDQSSISKRLTGKFHASEYFNLAGTSLSENIAEENLEMNNVDLYIVIPQNFENTLVREKLAPNQMIINAIDGAKAGIAMNYANNILMDFNQEIARELSIKTNLKKTAISNKSIGIELSNWFNPELKYTVFMVPGILVLLVTMIALFLSSMNIVREKEIGTIEQINATPIKKKDFIIGKLVPFLVIAMFELSFGLVIAKIIYNIPLEGSLILLFSFAIIYMLAFLGLGLFVSTFTSTQQQAVFISWFMMVIFILLSGLFTAVENMPVWVQYITYLNPIRYFIDVIRMLMLKGSGLADIQIHFMVIALFAIVFNSAAVLRYKKTN